jgi:hypothetical protein
VSMPRQRELERRRSGSMNDHGTVTLRPPRSTYLVFWLIWVVPFGLGAALTVQNRSHWQLLAVAIVGIVLSTLWIRLHEVRVSKGALTYRMPFWKGQSISLSEIEKAEVKVGVFRYRDRFKPTVRLEIVPKRSSGQEPIVIGLKLFAEQDVHRLFDAIGLDEVDKKRPPTAGR